MCPSVVVYAVDHIVAPSPSNNTLRYVFGFVREIITCTHSTLILKALTRRTYHKNSSGVAGFQTFCCCRLEQFT